MLQIGDARGKIRFQLVASLSLGCLPRQLDHKPQPVLAVSQFHIC